MPNMGAIQSVIIDDESRSVELLETLLEDYCPQVEVVGRANNVSSGIDLIREQQPDIVFLDIAMPDGDGFEVINSSAGNDFEVVFTTAHNQFALRAFEFSALHYLLKPIDIEQLKQTVERYEKRDVKKSVYGMQTQLLREGLEAKLEQIALPQKQGYEFIEIEDIIRIEGEDSYSKFILDGGKEVLVCKAIGAYEKLLEDHDFFRVHKKHLVNLSYIKGFQRGKHGVVTLKNGHEVALSYRRKEEFVARLKRRAAF